MAFGFDDFSKFFDPISDVLGTSGRQGVGLLQQKPEDIAMTAAAMYLAANGIPVSPEALAAAEPLAAAGESAALTTPQVAALAPEASGIMEAAQMDPALMESLNAPGTQTAGLGNLMETGYWEKPVNLNAPSMEDMGYKGINQYTGKPIVEGTSLNPFPGGSENMMSKTMAHAPDEINGLDYSSQIGYEQATSPALQDYQTAQFQDTLNTRMAEMPGANIQQFENPASTTQNMFRGNPAESGFQPPQVTRGGYFNNGINGEYTDTLSPFERGMETAGKYFDKASDYVDKNPYKSAAIAYYGASKLGLLDQPKQEPIADNYKNPYSMAGFRRSSPNPSAYQYTPRYAEGGIAGYARGGRSKAESAMDFYDAMNPQQESAPLRHGDAGIYYDMDPDTRYLDPMEAAMVRMSKLNSRTNVQAPTMAPSRRMGELDFKPVAAAQGGIMGYAAGGDVPVEDDEFNRLTGRGGALAKEPPSAWSQMTPAERGAYYAGHPFEGKLALAAQDALGFTTLGGFSKAVGPNAWYDSRLEKQGYDPQAFAYGPPDPNFSGQGNAAAKQEGAIAAVNAANAAGAGLAANPMGTDPSQRGGNGGIGSVGPVGRGEGGQDSAGEHGASLAHGGIAGYNLGGYAAGGNPRLLRGPGDGMSDNIPATINNRQPARLADGEFVIPADVVSHLGNGSTEAGAKQLHAMMTKVRKGRTGNPKQGKQINPRKYLPA